MPLPTDEKILANANALVEQLHALFGKHKNYRATHAKGLLLNGAFIPTKDASSLSSAPHFQNASTPVVVRFSSSTGIPQLPDNDANGEPRGFGVRFVLGDHKHTDIIAHSTPHFPTRTGEGFLALLKAIEASPPGTPSPTPVEQFLGREENAAALRFVTAPKPIPESFATQTYFGLNAYKFVHEAKQTFIRYRVIPFAGDHHLEESVAKSKAPDFLQDEIKARVSTSPVEFKLVAQIGEDGDTTDDVTKQWPEERKLVELGTIKLDSLEENDAEVQRKIIFDPLPRVQGIEASDDPLLELRAAVYLISGRERSQCRSKPNVKHRSLKYVLARGGLLELEKWLAFMTAVLRLHVTPFDQALLPAVLPPALQDQASDISFHTVATFPEAKFGFVTLPAGEAQRIKKKFHGCILKGRKMKVEIARPKKSPQGVTHSEDVSQTPLKNTRSRQAAASQKDTLPGIELPPERKVKRGWTSKTDAPEQKSTERRKSRKSFTAQDGSNDEGSKCLFVTKIPQTETQKKRKRTQDQKTVVPEFKNTVTSPTSEIDPSKIKNAKEYVDGRGWIDEAGNVVEVVKTRGRVSNVASKAANVASTEVSGQVSGDPLGLSAAVSDLESGDDMTNSAKASSKISGQKSKTRKTPRRPKESDQIPTLDDEIQTADVERLSISRSSGSPAPRTDSQPTSAPSNQVHPLEAFFKRPQAAASHSHTPKKPHLEVSTSFSFFGSDQDVPSNEDSSMLLPQTPFTQQDFRHRRQRSAAPTPDTALPGKSFFGESLGGGNSERDSDDKSSGDDSPDAAAKASDVASPDARTTSGRKEESEGAKWFYEHRGETNRSWKRRKREATKEKKLRERRAKR